MPDPYFSSEGETPLQIQSALTAVVEIMNYDFFLEYDKLHELQLFYKELSDEIYHLRRQNYGFGFEVIQPQMVFLSDRIYLYSDLYLEKEVPELNMMVFKIFVETLNLLLAVGLKHQLALRGFAGPDKGSKMDVSSCMASRVEVKDSIVLTDMLKIFNFNQIFPDDIDQKFAPALNFTSIHSERLHRANSLLKEISAIGIYFPEKIQEAAYAEVAIFSDMLIETKLEDPMRFVCNWQNWAARHPGKFLLEEVTETITEAAGARENIFASMWRKFAEIGER